MNANYQSTRKLFNRIDAMLAILLFAVLFLSACSPQTTPATGQAPNDGIPGFVEELQGEGAQVVTGEVVNTGIFERDAQVLKVNGQDVQVFEFASEAEQQAAAATIQANGYIVGTAALDWIGTPYFFAEGRLIALYIGDEAGTVELLSQVMGEPLTGPQA